MTTSPGTDGRREKLFRCNIDWVGRLIRFTVGVVLVFNGVVMWKYGVPGDQWGWHLFQFVMILAGSFAILEALLGWCALRAMGIRTRF